MEVKQNPKSFINSVSTSLNRSPLSNKKVKPITTPSNRTPILNNKSDPSSSEKNCSTKIWESTNTCNGIDLRTSKTEMSTPSLERMTSKPRIPLVSHHRNPTNSNQYTPATVNPDPSQMSGIIFQEFQKALYFSWLANVHLNNGLQIYQVFERINEESISESDSASCTQDLAGFGITQRSFTDVSGCFSGGSSSNDARRAEKEVDEDLMDFKECARLIAEQGQCMSQSGTHVGSIPDPIAGPDLVISDEESRVGNPGLPNFNLGVEKIKDNSYTVAGGTYKCANCNTNKTTLWRRNKLVSYCF